MRSTPRSRLRSTPRPPHAARLAPVLTSASLIALAVTALGGCTGTGATGGADADGKSSPPGGTVAPSAPPGKYRTLPQPCSALDPGPLKKLVPGAVDYAGTESLTYDTDRLVGCSWKGVSGGSTRTLSLSVVRVVSYNPSVSAEAEAETDFERKAAAASIPPAPPTGTGATSQTNQTGTSNQAGRTGQTVTAPNLPTDTATASGTVSGSPSDTVSPSGAGAPSGTGDPGHSSDPGDPSGTGDPDGSGANQPGDAQSHVDLAPRLLTGVGNSAFINDVLKTPASGPSRTVTLVFRTANVVATVVYTQSAPPGSTAPSSADLQKSVEKAAAELEHRVES